MCYGDPTVAAAVSRASASRSPSRTLAVRIAGGSRPVRCQRVLAPLDTMCCCRQSGQGSRVLTAKHGAGCLTVRARCPWRLARRACVLRICVCTTLVCCWSGVRTRATHHLLPPMPQQCFRTHAGVLAACALCRGSVSGTSTDVAPLPHAHACGVRPPSPCGA